MGHKNKRDRGPSAGTGSLSRVLKSAKRLLPKTRPESLSSVLISPRRRCYRVLLSNVGSVTRHVVLLLRRVSDTRTHTRYQHATNRQTWI